MRTTFACVYVGICIANPHTKTTHTQRPRTHQVEGLVVDDHAAGAGAHHEADVGDEVLQELPAVARRREVGGLGDHARHVRGGHGGVGV